MSLPLEFPLQIKEESGQEYVFDPVRKKYVVLTPEEWVRQHVLYVLNNQHQIHYSRMAVERQIKGSTKRFDVLIYDVKMNQPICIIECKSRAQKISQSTFDQVSRYNNRLQVPYLVVTNWEQWLAAKINGNSYELLSQFPKL